MKVDEAVACVRSALTKERFDHTLRVAETAVNLCNIHQVSTNEIEIAAILHDYAKYRPKEELKRWIEKSFLPKDLLNYHHELWHGPVASLMLAYEYGMDNKVILESIHYHTTGKAHMGIEEKIVFLADYIEPARSFPGVDDVRNKANECLNTACKLALRKTIGHLMNKEQPVYPDTFHAYNYFIQQS